MSRIEPPLAAWILDHCIPGQRDHALAGDLLEEFQHGRSNGWYWRQCLAAFLVGWVKYLGNRTSLIVFAALWSLLAPAWSIIIDRVRNRDLAWPLSVASWVALNLAFIWTGMLLFACLHRQFSHPFAARKLMRAFAVAAGVFLPAYLATFILANLFLWPGLEMQHYRGISPLNEIADFRIWADALRIPYFVTFLWSMWSIAPIMAATPVAVVEWSTGGAVMPRGTIGTAVHRDPYTVKRMLVFMVTTGLLNALIAGFVLCRLPEAQHPSLQSVLARATLYVAIGAIAGIVGAFLYWHNPASSFRADPPLPFPLFALVCAAGWVWVPAMVLFSEQVSALSAGVALIAAFLLTGELRRITLLVLPQASPPASALPVADRPIFAETLYRSPATPDGYLIALCIYAAGWAIASRSNMTAAALLALGACLFKLRTTFLLSGRFRPGSEYRRATLRLAYLALPAILVTFWALLEGVANRNHFLLLNGPGIGIGKSSGTHTTSKSDKSSTHIGSGFESVILWPDPPKKEIIAPVQPPELLAPGTTQPLVIRFNGEYWYLQPPDTIPGPNAHHANGTPLDIHIASSNSFPLMMQAHQYLRSPVRVARCREVHVEIESRETEPASITLAVWLKNSSAANAPSVYLGEQPIVGVGLAPASAASETLTFAVPASAKIRAFDEIAVMVLPDSGHQRVGPRIAIRQFEFLTR